MAAFVYTPAKTKLLKGELDFDLPQDFRVLLVSDTSTADTEEDSEFVSSVTTLDEVVATGYARQALTGEVVNEDLANDRAEFDAADVAFGALGNGVNDVISAVVLYRFVTVDGDSPLIAYIDTGGFPKTTNGGTFTIQWNAEGILQAT